MNKTLTINKKIIGENNYCYQSFDKLVLGDTVEGIEDRAFCGCNMLEHITFNASLAYLGELALAYCDSLKEVRLPSSFQSLGEKAFYHTPLERLELDNVKSIDREALSYTHLKELVLPLSLEEISLKQEIYTLKGIYYMGSREEWERVERYDEDDSQSLFNHVDVYFYDETHTKKGPYFYFKQGHIVTEEDLETPTPLLQYAYDKEGYYTLVDAHKAVSKKIVLDPRTQVIKSLAFEGMRMNTVILPKSLLKIESGAFCECYYLQELTHWENVPTLSNGSLAYISIDRTPALKYSYDEYRDIFGDGEGYSYPPDDLKDYTVFNKQPHNHNLTIQGSHLHILEHAYEYQEFDTVTIAGDDIVIGDRAFYGASIKTLIIKGSLIRLNDQAFALADITRLNADTTKNIWGTQAFSHVTHLKYLELKGTNNFICLDGGCFSYCVDLERIYLEGYSYNVSRDAFDNCINLKVIECSPTLDILCDFNNCFNLAIVAGTYHFDGHVMGGIMAYNTPEYILIPTTGYYYDTINKSEWLDHYYFYSPTFKEGHYYYIEGDQALDWSNHQVILDHIHFHLENFHPENFHSENFHPES